MKNLFLATAFAASLAAFALPTEAEAKVVIHFGIPHYSYQPGPDYYYRDGYGWYQQGYQRPGYYGRQRLSCGEARSRVRERGFRNVRTIECNGRTYTFQARRGDRRITVYVNSRSGAVWRS